MYFGVAVVTFLIMLGVGGITVAILNSITTDEAYSITLVILPGFAFIFATVVVLMLYAIAQKSQTLIDSLNRVANGDYSAVIEYKRRDTFGEVYKNFNKMTKELNSVKTMREDFVHDFSHEIKTPLFSIQGFANLLLEGGLSEEESKKFLKIISDEAGRLWRLADSTLTMAKLENQQLTGEKKTIRLDSEITECIIMCERDWEAKRIEISSGLDPLKIEGDAVMLREVWLNLLSNAIKFTPEGGKIEITLKRVGGSAQVAFKDSGGGVSPADMPKIFDKYYRGAEAKTTPGNGLGLAICKRICTLSGGDISVLSEEGKGSTFTVTLPVN